MEEVNKETPAQALEETPNQNPSDHVKKPKFSKKAKILILACVLLGLLALFGAPALLVAINPLERLHVAQINSCSKECQSSNDSMCVNKCLESRGSTARVTTAQVSKAPVEASPSPTIAPSFSVSKKITPTAISVSKAITPTKSARELSLFVNIGTFSNQQYHAIDKYHSVTLENQSTGERRVETNQANILYFYDLTPGAYRITATEISGYQMTTYQCYQCTPPANGNLENYSQNNYSININVEKGKTNGAFFTYRQ